MEGASLSDRSARSSSPSPSTNPPTRINCSDAGTPSEDSSARLRWRRVNASSCDASSRSKLRHRVRPSRVRTNTWVRGAMLNGPTNPRNFVRGTTRATQHGRERSLAAEYFHD